MTVGADANDRTFYLEAAGEPVHVVFHPTPAAPRGTAVILCPPFGFDEVCSYRPRREWARRLAAAGYPALRLSYPGTGESGGTPHDPGLLAAWSESVANAAAWVRHETGCSRVTAIGIQLGGLIAYLAAAEGAPITDLALWGVAAKGRTLIRQLRAFSALELDQCYEGLEVPPPLPDGQLQAGGYLLSAELTGALEQLDLSKLPLATPSARRALLLERDGIGVDSALQTHLESLGVAVTVAPGDGYAEMSSHPQQAFVPDAVIDSVTGWLDAGTPGADAADQDAGARVKESPTAVLRLATGSIRETPLSFELPFGRLSGVLTEPAGAAVPDLCGVFLNAGSIRACGPNRMWTELARRWATRGVRTFRLDVEGIGDADGQPTPYAEDDPLYTDKLVEQVIAALDGLQAGGHGERFLLMGLCGGAYWSFHAMLRDERVSSALLVNLRAIVWDRGLSPARDFRALLAQPSLAKIREQASAARVRALMKWLLSAPKRWLAKRRGGTDEAEPASDELLLERLCARGKPTLFLFSEHEPLHDELVRSGALARIERWPNVRLEYVPVRDHTFRPVQAQQLVHDVLDRALEWEFAPGTAPEPANTGA